MEILLWLLVGGLAVGVLSFLIDWIDTNEEW